ncbi:hypothetical protein ACP70R_045686 [Stipagrostis hirtigluma subsp. patula]
MAMTERKQRPLPQSLEAAPGQIKLMISKAMRWWEKGLQPNMREVESAQDLADSLLNAGDKLVVVDFFSLGCGGCRALHPKIAQFAEKYPDVQFLQVNYEMHKSMSFAFHRNRATHPGIWDELVVVIRKIAGGRWRSRGRRSSIGILQIGPCITL